MLPMTLEEGIEYCGVPMHIRYGMLEYIKNGRPAGDFLRAVFENDMMEAFKRADNTNLLYMRNIVMFIYEYAPMDCHGSPEKVKAWVKRHAEGNMNED